LDPEFDPLSPTFLNNPYPVYEKLRESAPVFWSPRVNSWMLTGYGVCDEVLRNWRIYGSDYRRAGRDEAPEMVSIQTTDPPEHTPLRDAMVDAIKDIQPDRLLKAPADRLRENILVHRGGEVDLVADILQPFATDVLGCVLGVDLFGQQAARWSEAVVRSMFAGLEPDLKDDGLTARRELSEALAVALQQAESGTFARLRQHAVTDTLVNTLRVLVLAVMNSGARAAGLAAHTVLRTEGGLAAFPITAEACHELIRFDGPFQATSRIAVADTTLGGRSVRRGDEITLLIGSANRDPRAFPDAQRIDYGRSPNRHLAFGVGIHYCLGAGIGIQLIMTFLAALRELAAHSEIVAEPVFDPNPTLRGVNSLKVRLR
jgi:cytochrome P450